MFDGIRWFSIVKISPISIAFEYGVIFFLNIQIDSLVMIECTNSRRSRGIFFSRGSNLFSRGFLKIFNLTFFIRNLSKS